MSGSNREQRIKFRVSHLKILGIIHDVENSDLICIDRFQYECSRCKPR
ncbi:protein of unknown function [Xenorhabdus doucetiae]|uniref:Uncharacterized protein n=1 Tax=Xenorhabdus doucetiae TaxID=351671 RepID=A0A068QZW4_9GAMM|nr:protein of unknown function [Xenorhabdus doucetiae]